MPNATKPPVPHRPTAQEILARQADAAKAAKLMKGSTAGKPAPKMTGKPTVVPTAAHEAPHAAQTAPVAPPAETKAASPTPAPKAVMNIPSGFAPREKGSKGNSRVLWCASANAPAHKVIQTEGKKGDRVVCPTCHKNLKVNYVKVKGSEDPAARVPYHGVPNKVPKTE